MEDVWVESISNVWCQTLLNRVDQLNKIEASSELDPSSEHDGVPEEDAAMISEELREAGISLVNKADVQEWLIVDRHKPGHTTPMMEDMIEAFSKPKHKGGKVDYKDIETSRLSFPRVSHSCTFYSMYGG